MTPRDFVDRIYTYNGEFDANAEVYKTLGGYGKIMSSYKTIINLAARYGHADYQKFILAVSADLRCPMIPFTLLKFDFDESVEDLRALKTVPPPKPKNPKNKKNNNVCQLNNMDYVALSPVEITNIIETVDSAKLCGYGYSKDNILFYVTNGSQFTKLFAKCGRQILDRPNKSGEYYTNELVRVKLMHAIETGNEQLVSVYSSFYESIINEFGHLPLLRISSETKECSVHTLLKNKDKHKRLEDIYKLAVEKIPRKQGVSLADLAGNNIYGEPAEVVVPPTPRRGAPVSIVLPQSTPPSTPPPTPQVAAQTPVQTSPGQSQAPHSVPSTPRGSSTPQGLPASLPPSTSLIQPDVIPEDSTLSQINPFTGKQTPSACITVLKGYESHFFNPNFTSYLKTIRKQ